LNPYDGYSRIGFPRYGVPPRLLTAMLADLLTGRRRSFRRDAQAWTSRLDPPLRLLGREHLPRSGPLVMTVNHYQRAGFRAWWIALAVAATVPWEMHWMVTAELTFPGRWYGPLGRPLSRLVLRRLARMYGFTPMPPMPPRPGEAWARAAAVRAAMEFVRRAESPVIGLAPEGGDQPGGALDWPPPGAGRFLLLLAGAGLRVCPAGIYEADGALCLRFGPAYALHPPPGLTPNQKDRWAARVVMENLAGLLPEVLHGPFHSPDEVR
jgi:hypothetical protein